MKIFVKIFKKMFVCFCLFLLLCCCVRIGLEIDYFISKMEIERVEKGKVVLRGNTFLDEYFNIYFYDEKIKRFQWLNKDPFFDYLIPDGWETIEEKPNPVFTGFFKFGFYKVFGLLSCVVEY